ncbi:hypothetical protein [Actinocrispum sp. NPDC049592]|uniref:hypothetical protein n=1 Tax=Actinocrispum sp. NPDC049592 TaxID=3154835 RepID=UPI0034207756
MSGWRTDDKIEEAQALLQDRFLAMHDGDFPAAGIPHAQIAGLRRDLEIWLSIDPQRVADEYERIYQAMIAIGDNADAVTQLRESIRHLANWTGAAADEFKNQIDRMEIFCEEQQTRMLRGLLGLAATYTAVVEGRESFYQLLLATDAAGRKEMEDQEKEDTKLQSALLFDIVSGILSADPKKLIGSAVVTAVDMGKDFVDRVIEGNDADQVMDSYRREADWLNESFGNALDHIRTDVAHQIDDAMRPSSMYKPLPLICNVNSPDFRWENFQDMVHNPGSIGPIVEAERRKYAEEKKRQSDIDKRMNPGNARRGAI